MNLKELTREELEEQIEELEDLIHEKGVGSDYLKKAERYQQKAKRIQRDLNIALLLGAAATVFGLTAWAVYKSTRD